MKACPQCRLRYPADTVHCFLDGAKLTSFRDPLLGATIGGCYLIEEVLGEGGMAMVYRAHHKLVDRRCAVKVMNPSLATNPVVRERFRREAKAAQVLAHPNVIEIFDQGETSDGTPFFVMELLEGATLAELISRGAPPVPRSLAILIQLARGIARAHDLGVVHRDLKPENIFVCRRSDGTDLVKILDFGIARSRTDARITNAGELFGTPQYMAPERVTDGEAGPSVDLYALGVIFFETATGALPFNAGDATTLLIKQVTERPPRPRDVAPTVPEELERIILGLLEKDPRSRPVDAHRVVHDLVAAASRLGVAAPPEPGQDPSTVRRPVRVLPAVVVEQWEKRVNVFERMLASLHGAWTPMELERALVQIKVLVGELAEARRWSATEQRRLEEIDARGREGRQRLGFAVDALGLDASRAKEELRESLTEATKRAEQAQRAAAAYADTQRETLMWEGRAGLEEPYRQLAKAYRRCADAVESWFESRRDAREAQTVFDGKERLVHDLDFQIAQLRSALAARELANDRERHDGQRRLVELNSRAERLEAQLLALATAFCEPLRTRPELGPLFQQLESDAAAGV